MVRLWVRLTPRGGADRIDGIGPAGELRARVRADADPERELVDVVELRQLQQHLSD